jgi:hypothetical protein
MPGIATQFEILRLTIERMEAEGLTQFTQVMKANLPYAYLGAIGSLLGDLIPFSSTNNYSMLWKLIFGQIGTSPSGGKPGIYDILKSLKKILSELDEIAKDENVDAICQLKESGNYKQIEEAATNLQQAIAILSQTDRKSTFAQIAQNIVKLRPKICTSNKTDPVPPPETWKVRDFLHWKKPERFLRKLIDKAKETNDNRLLAYAYGYLVSYAGKVCGASFINSIVGGSARTQWWRQRLAQNYIDAWVYGYYNITPRPTMTGDTPSPPYSAWSSLRYANLHEKIALGSLMEPESLMGKVRSNKALPKQLPDDFAQRWFEAFQSAYSPPFPDSIKAENLNDAYVMTWLILWFFTSKDSLLSFEPNESMQPPDDCGAAPSELDPFKKDPGTGDPILPPPAEIDADEDEAKKVCAIITVILGGLATIFGAAALGGTAIAAGISMLDCDSLAVVNWKKLRCDLYWYRLYLYNGIKGLNKLLALVGFGYPLASELGTPEDTLELLGKTFQTGINLVKSKNFDRDRGFPSKCWINDYEFDKLDDFKYALEFFIPFQDKFNVPPTSANPGFESESAIAYLTDAYPSFFVDDDTANPLSNGDVKTKGSFPYRKQESNTLPVQFGNAVANAVDLFKNLDRDFPDWNLDADRGLAYLTWQFKGFYDPDSVQIEPEP